MALSTKSGSKKPTEVLTIYLARQRVTDALSLIRREAQASHSEIDVTTGVTGHLFTQPSMPKPPRWARFFAGATDLSRFGTISSAAAVLIVPVEGRLAAVTFGHGRHLLVSDSWEERFGLRVAVNSIDEKKLRSIDKHTFDAIARNSREQAGREASARDFGIDVEQDLLRAVTGLPSDASLGKRMYGMDALSVAVGTSLVDLPPLLCRYMRKYASTAYRKTFPWIDQIAEVADLATIGRLDATLLAKISAADYDGLSMAVPEIVPWQRVGGFRYGLRASNPEHYDMDARTFFEEVGLPSSIGLLRHKDVHCCDHDGRPIDSWSVYRCLYAEIESQKESYVLSGGKWYRIASDFVKEVDKAYAQIPSSTLVLPEYDDDSETAYNRRVAKADPSRFALMDADEVIYGGGRSSVEFCDLYSHRREIIHLKRYGSSGLLSHLFAQGLVSGELFQTDPTFRSGVNKKLPRSYRLSDPKTRPGAGQYTVVFGVISESTGPLTLPFFSRLNIKHAAKRLAGYGYTVQKLKVSVADQRRKKSKYRSGRH